MPLPLSGRDTVYSSLKENAMRPAASLNLPDSHFANFHLPAPCVTDAHALAALPQHMAP